MSIDEILEAAAVKYFEKNISTTTGIQKEENLLREKLKSFNLERDLLECLDSKERQHADNLDSAYKAGFKQGVKLINDLLGIVKDKEVQGVAWR